MRQVVICPGEEWFLRVANVYLYQLFLVPPLDHRRRRHLLRSSAWDVLFSWVVCVASTRGVHEVGGRVEFLAFFFSIVSL